MKNTLSYNLLHFLLEKYSCRFSFKAFALSFTNGCEGAGAKQRPADAAGLDAYKFR